MCRTPLTCLSTSGSRSRRYCWKCWGKEAKVCLFIKALRLVLTRMDPGVSMSMSSALVHFKCPVKGKARGMTWSQSEEIHVHQHMSTHTHWTWAYPGICLFLLLLKWFPETKSENKTLIIMDYIYLSHISINI